MDAGAPVNTASIMYDGTSINGPVELREFLLKYSEQFVRALTEKLLTYALGRGVEYYDMPTVRSIVSESAVEGHRLGSIILAIVNSDPFQMNTKATQPDRVASSDSRPTPRIEAPRSDGRTALMGAAHKGRGEIVRILVDHGADMAIRDFGSRDSIHNLAGTTWQAIDYADGLVRVGVQSAIEHPETAQLLRTLMVDAGLPVPPEGRTLDSVCITDLCR